MSELLKILKTHYLQNIQNIKKMTKMELLTLFIKYIDRKKSSEHQNDDKAEEKSKKIKINQTCFCDW